MKFALVCMALVLTTECIAQNYSGIYGYSEDHKSLLKRHPEAGKDASGYQKDLVLLQIKGNQYKFWLFVIRGYPGYNSGHTDGIINVKGDSAVFVEADTVESSGCKLVFHLAKNKIFIDHQEGDCGFGANVTAHGDYPRLASRTPTTSDIANSYQEEIPVYQVVSAKATVHKTPNENDSTKQYFVKNDTLYAFYEEEDFIYVQFVTKTGKYIEGWIKKSDVNKTSSRG